MERERGKRKKGKGRVSLSKTPIASAGKRCKGTLRRRKKSACISQKLNSPHLNPSKQQRLPEIQERVRGNTEHPLLCGA